MREEKEGKRSKGDGEGPKQSRGIVTGVVEIRDEGGQKRKKRERRVQAVEDGC